MNQKQKIFLLIILVITFTLGFLTYYRYSKTVGRTEIKLGNTPCEAQAPECGYCPGEKISGKCYVKN